jgi:phenylacetate-coenzyme A ligase PaaK-like adenylate-forming protein
MTLEQIVELLEQSQWWTPEQIESRQQNALARVISHHTEHNESFKQRLAEQNLTAQDVSTLDGLKQLKPFTKRHI